GSRSSTPTGTMMSDTSFPHGERSPMSGDTTGKTAKPEPATDWRRLRGMADAEVHAAVIADPEIKPTDEAFWKAARVVMPQSKRTVTTRLAAATLGSFR